MKEKLVSIKMLIVLNLLIFLLSIIDYLALHDIANDYVSAKILESLKISTSSVLPAWTATAGEWTAISLSFWLRMLLIIANLVLLWKIGKEKIQQA